MKTTIVMKLARCALVAAVWWLGVDAALAQGNTGTRRSTATGTGTTRRSTGSGVGATRDYMNNTMVGEAMVTSDPETRRLIVITDDETAEHVNMVISNLDRPKPQALIKVVFLEATFDNSLDLGVEGSFTKSFGNSFTGAVSQAFPPLALPSSGGVYSLAGQDFQVTLRALATAGKAEVLSRPSVLARNNQQALITVGQQVPLITSVRYDSLGNQINSVTYTDIGIILRVTPFIGADGMVEMIVAPEISELANRTQWVSLGTGGSAPTINQRSANTVVVTPDGQTVVIGGLMQKTKAETVSKIPLLGDIPLLGVAFRRTISEARKTELLIFLTPYIVRDQAQMAAMTEREKSSGLIIPPESPTEQELNKFLDRLPPSGDVPKSGNSGKSN